MKKNDILVSLAIGELSALLLLSIAKNINLNLPFLWLLVIVLPIVCLIGLYAAYFLRKVIPLIWQAAKFILVGVLNTLVDLGVLNLLMLVSNISSGVFFSVFKTISFSVSVTNSYFWNKLWTFKKENAEKIEVKSGKEVIQFFVVSVIGWLLNLGISSFIVNVVGPQFGLSSKLWANVGALSATGANMVWNFIGYKFVVFKQKS